MLWRRIGGSRRATIRISAEIWHIVASSLALPDLEIVRSKSDEAAFLPRSAALLAYAHWADDRRTAVLEAPDDTPRQQNGGVGAEDGGQSSFPRSRVDERGMSYQYLDGSTPAADRERRVAAFQAGEADLFLISLRAGRTGLNLTAADYVVHLDPWWNPAVEDQASDRAHRIGQTRPVTIYRLVMADSIEQRIVDLHRAKRELAEELLEGADTAGRLTKQQLLDLIGG